MITQATLDRFWTKVDRSGGNDACWQWQGTDGGQGYGIFALTPDQSFRAHRFAYEAVIGPIPEGKQLDHLCRNRGCVNPAHLEPVTSKENTLRGVGPTAINRRKTHCKHGHELAGDNLLADKAKIGWRGCRTCKNAWTRAYHQRRKEAANG